MERTRIRRTVMLVTMGALLIGGIGLQLASASGGGGCGAPVTDGHGVRIRIHRFCFTPTILHIRPGQTVTWRNRDPFAHTVMGANAVWGSFGGLKDDGRVTYRFVEPGVYPYVCTIHPGMVGAVVVGSGAGRGDAGLTTAEAGPVQLVTPSPAPEVIDAAQPAPAALARSDAGRTVGIAVALAGMLVIAVALAHIGRRRNRTAP